MLSTHFRTHHHPSKVMGASVILDDKDPAEPCQQSLLPLTWHSYAQKIDEWKLLPGTRKNVQIEWYFPIRVDIADCSTHTYLVVVYNMHFNCYQRRFCWQMYPSSLPNEEEDHAPASCIWLQSKPLRENWTPYCKHNNYLQRQMAWRIE